MPSSPRLGTVQDPGKQDETTSFGPEDYLQRLSDAFFRAGRRAHFRRTDRLFAWLLICQALAAFLVALLLAVPPLRIAPSMMAVLFLNALVVSLPAILAFVRQGEEVTRHGVAAAQMVMSAVLIHVTHGRIESHFHVLISLTLLAFYQDWRVLGTACAVTVGDHIGRGLLAPASLYGTEAVAQSRILEHCAWIVFCNAFLVHSCVQSVREMRANAERHARLVLANAVLRRAENKQTSGEVPVGHDCETLANGLASCSRFESGLDPLCHGTEQ